MGFDSKKASMENGKLPNGTIPWYNKSEFEQVYHGLFSGNIFDMKWAVDKISMWEGRCKHILPVGIDATAALIRANIQDMLCRNNATTFQPDDLRNMYAQGLTRFINLLSEVYRPYGSPMPVRIAAKKAGIPEWIVDLRHEGTHLRVPSLNQLRHGVDFALSFLQKKYWEEELVSFNDLIEIHESTDDAISSCIATYQKCRYSVLSGENLERPEQLKKLLKKMKRFLKQKPMDFLKSLLTPGSFLTARHDLMKLLQNTDDISFVEDKKIELPLILVEFWMPVIRLIATINLLQQFVEQLLETMKILNPLQQQVAACWVLEFVKNEVDSSVLQEIPYKYRPSFNFLKLMGSCMEGSCSYTPALAPIIVNRVNPPMHKMKAEMIIGLVAVELGTTVRDNEQDGVDLKKERDPNTLYNAEQLKSDLKIREKNRPKSCIYHEPPVDDIGLLKKPLGYAFGDLSELIQNNPPVINLEIEPVKTAQERSADIKAEINTIDIEIYEDETINDNEDGCFYVEDILGYFMLLRNRSSN